ncbi:hypothetical protein GQ600_12261 [Phytophthora cactorum]|nr:hypothetical protein GQ600_12261 [Phytophthora cactorum]
MVCVTVILCGSKTVNGLSKTGERSARSESVYRGDEHLVCEEMLSVIATDEVIAKFTSSRLRTEFATLSGKELFSFENIFGGLCRGWLNDSHVDFCLKNLVIRS